MEPMSALSVATAVMQFLDFAGTVASGTWKIYKSTHGEFERNADIRLVTVDLTNLNDELRKSIDHPNLAPFSSRDSDILKLGRDCNEIGDELLSALSSLKSQNKHSLWANFRAALRTIWSQPEVDSLYQKLESYRQQISMHILVSLREQITSSHQSQQIGHDQTHKSLFDIQDLCRKLLMDVAQNITWQNDVVDAINRSYDHTARGPDASPTTANIQQVVRTVDVDSVHQRLLHFLRFHEIDSRYERIALAHQKTFDWIFRAPPVDNDSAKWADFTEWIKGDDPLYWVTGKAGAGKSTLMRYIFDHERTQEALSSWAADRPLIVVSFFFWNSGTEIQMSNEGLLRTLIYQMLEKRPDLSSIAFPHRVEVGILFGQRVLEKNPWSWEELAKAFRIIVQKITETSSVMFFIDGLDEFKGVSSDLIDFITSLIVPHTKICASSRPWIAFEDAFKHRPHLRLEDLTYGDIKHYVTTKMTANAGYEVLQQLDPEYSTRLIENVCTKSDGVFLWVFLVTRSLLEGLSEGERLSDLQARLDSLPSDLEDLFWGILRRLDKFHFSRASQLFQLVRASLTPLTLLDMSYADEDDPEFAIKMATETQSIKQAISRAELMRRRISACCKGLIEGHSNNRKMLPAVPINYLHRTVKDFLDQDNTWKEICEATDDTFNPNLRLYNAEVALLKTLNPDSLSEDYFWSKVTYAIEYATRASSTDITHQKLLLDEIDKVATTLTTKPRNGFSGTPGNTFLQDVSTGAKDGAIYWTWTRIDCRPVTTFLGLAVQCQLVDYVEATIKARKSPDLNYYSQLLQLAAVHYRVFANETNRPAVHHNELNLNLIRLLFAYGANPNYKVDRLTVWEQFLDNWEVGDDEYMNTAQEFVIHGADPRTSHVTAFYDRFSDELQQLIKQKRKETRWSHYGSKFRRSKGGDDD